MIIFSENNEVLPPLEPVQGHHFKPMVQTFSTKYKIELRLKKIMLQDLSLLGNDFVEATFCIFVSWFDGSRLDGLLLCKGGVGCSLVLCFVEAP